MKNKADHEKEIKTLKDEMNLHKIISAKKSKDLENKITEVNNLYSRFDKLENLVKVTEKRIVDISEKKIEDLGNKSLHTKIKGQEKAIEEKTSNSEKKSQALEKKVEEVNIKLETFKASCDNLKTENKKNKSEIELLKIKSSDKIIDVKNDDMDDAVKLTKKKDVITVDSMSFAKILKENEAKNKTKSKICRERVGLSIFETSGKDCKRNQLKFNQCDFETYSEGQLILHENNNH